jgi:hypothetical protein
MSDFEASSKKGIQGGKYKPGEKNNWGFGGAYYGGVDYKGQEYKGKTDHDISVGAFGWGGKITVNDSGEITDWFVGFDPSVNMQFGIGVEGIFRIGFAK